MGLFLRRPFCLCCCLFLLTSYVCIHLASEQKIMFSILLGIVASCLILLCFIIKKMRKKLAIALMCIAFVILAVLGSFARIDLPQKRAQDFAGDRQAVISVIDKEYSTDYSSAYVGNIEGIGNVNTSIRALIVTAFKSDISVGDTVYANVSLMDMETVALGSSGNEKTGDSSIIMLAVIYERNDMIVEPFDKEQSFFDKLFAKNGVFVILSELKDIVSQRIDRFIGKWGSGLAKGFLLGDKSDLSASVIRDFRRTGASHLFAVSGLHISILIGAIEIFLKKLYVPKSVRCVILSIGSFVMLCLTGFSMSAMRSVFMLWIVYVTFLFSEENDSPTTLFFAITIIILIFPYAVYELGLWMSFLATLGLVTIYPVVERKIRNFKVGKTALSPVIKVFKTVILSACMTIIASMFLLFISFAIFGEISITSVPANILLSPLAAMFLPLCTLTVIFGGVPILGMILAYASRTVCAAILWIVERFSAPTWAMVSLKYDFAAYLVIAFTVLLCVMLIIKIRKKWLFVIPPLAFAIAFTSCIGVFNATNGKEFKYYGNYQREMISLTNDEELAIIDLSNGYYSEFYEIMADASSKGATEIQSIVLTKLGKRYVSCFDRLFRSDIVRELYIPEPISDEEITLAKSLIGLAKECGVSVEIYDNTSQIELCDGIAARIIRARTNDKEAVSLFVSGGNSMLGYTDAFISGTHACNTANELISKCDTLIIGNNGIPDEPYGYDVSETADVIFSSEELMASHKMKIENERCYYHREGRFEFVLNVE